MIDGDRRGAGGKAVHRRGGGENREGHVGLFGGKAAHVVERPGTDGQHGFEIRKLRGDWEWECLRAALPRLPLLYDLAYSYYPLPLC